MMNGESVSLITNRFINNDKPITIKTLKHRTCTIEMIENNVIK